MGSIRRIRYASGVQFEPYWREEAPRPSLPDAPVPPSADVVVIGSGYSGLSAALTLARHGRQAVVLEAGGVGHGASTRNGGAVGDTLRVSFARMAEKMGPARAAAFYTGVRDARSYLEHLLESEGIQCRYAPVGRFVGAHLPGDYEAMARDLELRKKHLGFEADMVPKAEMHSVIGTDAYHGGRLIRTDGNLQPALYHRGLLDRVLAAGITVVSNTPVTRVEREGGKLRAVTGRGQVRAGHVIVATNGYTDGVSRWLRRRLIPIQSQIIATEPLPAATMDQIFPGRHQYGDTRLLHNYFRASPDGTRVLWGGRAGAAAIEDPRRSGMHLYRQMTNVFPILQGSRITHSWVGFVAYTFDHLPHMATYRGIHYPAGYCGSGVVMATYLGHKTALKVVGSPEAATPFDRVHPTVPLYTGQPWFMPAIYLCFGLRDRILSIRT